MSIRNDRLARARAALQSAEVASGVRSLESNSILEASLSPGVYHVHSGVEGVVYSLAQIMTDQMWGAVVGIPDVGWEAASQMGLDLTRVVAVPRLPDAVGKTVGVLIEGFDVVALGDSYVSAPNRRALAARIRRMDRFLLTAVPWEGISRPVPAIRGLDGVPAQGIHVIWGGVAV